MSIRERIAAYKAAVGDTASGELRYPLSDADAVALVGEIGLDACRHSDQVAGALPALKAALDEIADAFEKKDVNAALSAASRAVASGKDFWDGLEGQDVDGVTIIRRRA